MTSPKKERQNNVSEKFTATESFKVSESVIENPWSKLGAFTDARIGLGRTGVSLPTDKLLAFQLAHAQAQDAVHLPLDTKALSAELEMLSESSILLLHSQAENRAVYLQRPDLGRLLDSASAEKIQSLAPNNDDKPTEKYDLAIVVVDGLSSFATQKNSLPMLQALQQKLTADPQSWNVAPLTIVEQGRVAIGDDIGERLKANSVVVMIGERPGLSSPDSLGLYLTWQPKVGKTDAERNCISNVRPEGLSYSEAGNRLFYLLSEARTLKLSGVNLKDRTDVVDDRLDNQGGNFLVGDY
ncbi:ethanolamine ammonia-lyase subunit EutC [Reinekea thalattae]|uniref:Ethanolamine ammonia-lyase small subunit n=1 Tax=Reinekea thalattae TaxID=2593301 RepID=A0A5C8ZC74_9GAMM|nr:ethanolamine ammonia-lyase subunit EutC [Reinekea thalattae]TXR54516.1 ethanolamine ammonia-lyase subunit EutC [Reinekea thalattae]